MVESRAYLSVGGRIIEGALRVAGDRIPALGGGTWQRRAGGDANAFAQLRGLNAVYPALRIRYNISMNPKEECI
jgi:hypothetical protein